MIVRGILLFLACFAHSITGQANTLQTPLDQTLSSGTLHVSLKNTYLHDAMGFDLAGNSNHLINGPSLNFHFGLGEMADFELNWDILRITEKNDDSFSSDLADVSFFTKMRFKKETIWPSFGIRVGAKLPNASDETKAGTDLSDTFVWALFGKQLGQFHIFSNLGLEIFDKKGGGQHDAFGYGLAVSYPFTKKFEGSTELSGRVEREGSPVNRGIFQVALAYIINPWKTGLGVTKGFIAESENFGVHFSLTRTFNVY